MTLSSPSFYHNGTIPLQYTCEGDNTNPPLVIRDVPKGAKSLILILEDPDAPHKTWTHWLLYNIPPGTTHIPENEIPSEALEGLANGGTFGYEGPCPPSGTHHYIFTLYAIDIILAIKPNAVNKQTLLSQMNGHIIDRAELVGLYVLQKRVQA
ncbi:YbhB/YbcL family Raf kinase inhibitor-like protein [Candidatus Roizmanbacteria bacterium]|nr:YbhB/YbcL family Raf kinase inhibitor-like protein [Candidatus Roizmanbacteria bacterium]